MDELWGTPHSYVELYVIAKGCRKFWSIMLNHSNINRRIVIHHWRVESPFPIVINHGVIPSGKHLQSYGKPPFLIGKSSISMAIFNSYFDITRG